MSATALDVAVQGGAADAVALGDLGVAGAAHGGVVVDARWCPVCVPAVDGRHDAAREARRPARQHLHVLGRQPAVGAKERTRNLEERAQRLHAQQLHRHADDGRAGHRSHAGLVFRSDGCQTGRAAVEPRTGGPLAGTS